ncbi:PAS domain-containing protein [Desertibaculum subflavum]|uniref:PAS domain-containing protein n=1 Tax=Desertibaculum subflavum TaxID=2268458 RepID=UPI000E673893
MYDVVPGNPHLDLYRHWEAARRGRAMPAADDFTAALLPPALQRHLAVVEVGENGFRCRHAGTQLAADHGHGLAGAWLGTHHRALRERDGLPALLRAAMRTRNPVFAIGRGRTLAGALQSVACLLLPLGRETGVDSIVICRLGEDLPAAGEAPAHAAFDFALGRAFGVTSLPHLEDLCRIWPAGPAELPAVASAAD